MPDTLEPATLLKLQTALLWPLYHHRFLEGTLSNFMQLLRLLFAEQSSVLFNLAVFTKRNQVGFITKI